MKKAEIAFDTVIKFTLGILAVVLLVSLLMSAYQGPRENIEDCPGNCKPSCGSTEVSWGTANNCADGEICCVGSDSFTSG